MHFHSQFFIYIAFLLLIIRSITSENWNYHDQGPDVWSDTYSLCNGRSQSPILIRTACTAYRSFTPFKFTAAYDLTHNFTLINNGHTITGTYNDNAPSPLNLTGGGLNGTFEFVSFHLHWGENYKSGSEHQVNGMKYAAEIHFIHKNYATSESAVLGFFMERNRNSNLVTTRNRTIEEWKRYFAVADDLQQINNSIVHSLNLASLMGDNLDDFWRYQGSLTTPPCTEGIIWTVFRTPTLFNENELKGFRMNISSKVYRSPQPLYNRTVYRNFPNEVLSSIPDYDCCSDNSHSLTNKLSSCISIQLMTYICLFCFRMINK